MDAARELAQLRERLRELLLRLREPQGEREGDEPLLRAVVEVALEPAAFRVRRLDDARARLADLMLLLLAVGDLADDRDDLVRGARDHARLVLALDAAHC